MSILEKIYNASLKFSAPLTAEETYEAIVKEAARLVDGEHGSIHLSDSGELKRVYATDPTFYKIKIRKNGVRFQVFKDQKPVVLRASKFRQLEKRYPGLKEFAGRSVILIPLSYQRQSTGLLSVISFKNKYFSKRKLEILKLFGSMASLAVKKAQLYTATKDALDTRDLFISLAAHELRTPLTTITGYVQLLLTKLRSKKSVDPKWIYELAFETNRLRLLVNEFLEINRIRTGQLQFDWKEAHLRKIIQKAISSFNFNKPDRKIVFKNRLNGVKDLIVGDRDKLIQVLINLLENADKYSPANKKILLKLKYRTPSYIVEVIDRGQGIPKEELPKIFRGFYKGENSIHEGMGLGLYLSKNIIDSHRGEINIKSKLGRGTTVEIKLPKLGK